MMSLLPLLRPCTNTQIVTMGLPYIHRYNQAYKSKTSLIANDFYPQQHQNQPLKGLTKQFIKQPIKQSNNQQVNKSIAKLVSQLANPLVDQLIDQLINLLTDYPIDQPISQTNLLLYIGEPLKVLAKGCPKKLQTVQIG